MSAADTRHPGLLMLNRGAVPPWATQACQGQFQLPSGTAQSTSAGAAAPGAPDSSPGSPLSAVCLQAHPLLARDGGPKLAFPPLGSNELNTWRDIWTEGKPRWRFFQGNVHFAVGNAPVPTSVSQPHPERLSLGQCLNRGVSAKSTITNNHHLLAAPGWTMAQKHGGMRHVEVAVSGACERRSLLRQDTGYADEAVREPSGKPWQALAGACTLHDLRRIASHGIGSIEPQQQAGHAPLLHAPATPSACTVAMYDGALGRPRPRNQGSAQSGHAQSRSIRAALDLLALGVAFRSGPEEPRSKGRRGTAPATRWCLFSPPLVVVDASREETTHERSDGRQGQYVDDIRQFEGKGLLAAPAILALTGRAETMSSNTEYSYCTWAATTLTLSEAVDGQTQRAQPRWFTTTRGRMQRRRQEEEEEGIPSPPRLRQSHLMLGAWALGPDESAAGGLPDSTEWANGIAQGRPKNHHAAAMLGLASGRRASSGPGSGLRVGAPARSGRVSLVGEVVRCCRTLAARPPGKPPQVRRGRAADLIINGWKRAGTVEEATPQAVPPLPASTSTCLACLPSKRGPCKPPSTPPSRAGWVEPPAHWQGMGGGAPGGSRRRGSSGALEAIRCPLRRHAQLGDLPCLLQPAGRALDRAPPLQAPPIHPSLPSLHPLQGFFHCCHRPSNAPVPSVDRPCNRLHFQRWPVTD
ncbi:hypothetical protein Purlil1_9078 [Purpureocillium lilacinum]|uniref:Uncharacterized protein n=1 Tax=Purpureocillium lilacinum TaxID=33203 RepID=A0ABR0BTD0_PURLI|nr:hypothetical protein Purlil1_9078 [Purpureocillium lilacinum]